MTDYLCFGYSQSPASASALGVGNHTVTITVMESQQCDVTVSVICDTSNVTCPADPVISVGSSCFSHFPLIGAVNAPVCTKIEQTVPAGALTNMGTVKVNITADKKVNCFSVV